MHNFLSFIGLTIFIFLADVLSAQPTFLNNASFEGEAKASSLPAGWYNCGPPGQTPPDTHPAGFFEVTQRPKDGKTYLGLVVRDNETWEAAGQKLAAPLEAGGCYEFNMYLSKSSSYYSFSMAVEKNVQFTEPVVLRVWGGNSYCDKRELLYESRAVKHTDWRRYDMKFSPTQTHRYISFEAFYKVPVLFPYRGNLLLDNCSAIIPCGEEMPENPQIAMANTPSVKKPKPRPTPPKPPVVKPKPTPKPPIAKVEEPKLLPNLKRENITTGQTIKVDHLFFAADSTKPNKESYAVLDEIYAFLKQNKDIKIEIGGHTNNVPPDSYCDELSSARAKTVANYLVIKGIPRERIAAKGYGKRNPISTNDTREGRRKNQRVEIKILSMG